MAEEEAKKKRGVVKRILKWFGLGVLALLIVLGLIFRAPWKVMVLLAVFLLAHTVLPKPGLKWFWVGVGVVVIALVIWVFLPEDYTGWRPYTFDEELAALEAKYAIPDEENAATIYYQLLDAHEPNCFWGDFLLGEAGRVVRFEGWSSADYPEVAEWLESHERTISKLLEAAQVKECRFPIVSDSFKLSQTMERLTAMRRLGYLLVYAANNDLGEGRIGQAIEKGIAILRMSGHQYQQGAIVDVMVGNALEALACKQFNRIVIGGDASENHLRFIEEALSDVRFDWSNDFPRVIDCEKLLFKNTVCSSMYEVSPSAMTRLSRDPLAIIRAQFPNEIPSLNYWQKKLAKIKVMLGWFSMPPTPQKASEIVDAAYERYYAMAEPGFDWQREPRRFSLTSVKLNYRGTVDLLLDVMGTAYDKIHDNYLRMAADKRGSRILVALRRYKNANDCWPESLDSVQHLVSADTLIDPLSGDSFVYMLTDEDFILYSKGANRIDEGGQYESHWPNEAQPDDRLIWPQRTRDCEAEEESADGERE